MIAKRPPRLPRSVPIAVLIAALLLYLLNQIYLLTAGWNERMHGNDFWHLYSGALALRRGLNPYDGEVLRQVAAEAGIERLNPFVYLPFTGLMLIPLTMFRPDRALFIWFLLNHVFFLGGAALLAVGVRREERWWVVGLLMGLGAFFFPLTRTLTAGQLNCLLLLLFAAALYLLGRRREVAGGILVGAAAMVKVSPAFLILFLAWKRRWRALTASLATVAALLVFSVAALGPGNGFRVHRDAVEVFRQMGYGRSTWSEYGERFHVARGNISPSSVIYRLLLREPGYAEDPDTGFEGLTQRPGLAQALSILLAAAMIAGLGWVTRDRREEVFSAEFSLAVIVMLLLPSLFWDHYLVLLFVPLAVLLAASLRRGRVLPLVVLAGSAMFLARPYQFFGGPVARGWGTLWLAPHLLAVAVIAALLFWELRRPAPEPDEET